MELDVVLTTILFIIILCTLFIYDYFKKKATSIFEDRKFSTRDVIVMVAIMAVVITIIALIPRVAIQLLFMIVYSYMMGSFTYILLKKWWLAVIPPAFFVLTYLFFQNMVLLNVFAIIFAVIISVYLGVFFSWKTALLFTGLLTVVDVIQVFITGFMIQAAEKMLDLKLPIALVIPTFPSERGIFLGLGDVFLAGLLTIQTVNKYGKKAGILTALTISLAMFIFEVIIFNGFWEGLRGFPATVIVVLGWLFGLGIISGFNRYSLSPSLSSTVG